jgi:hypothetical protein
MSKKSGLEKKVKAVYTDSEEDEGKEDKDKDAVKRLDEVDVRKLKKHVQYIDKRWDGLLRENNRLTAELSKAQSSNS